MSLFQTFGIIAAVLVFFGLIGLGCYFFANRYQKAQKELDPTGEISKLKKTILSGKNADVNKAQPAMLEKPTVDVSNGDQLSNPKVLQVFAQFTKEEPEMNTYVTEYLEAADELKKQNILASAGYNCTGGETFCFFQDNFRNHAEPLELYKLMVKVLNFMKNRERPWSVIFFKSAKKNANDRAFIDETKMFVGATNVKVLYAGNYQTPTLYDYMKE